MWLRRVLPSLMLFVGFPALAQEETAAPAASRETAKYVVRTGDTLIGLTARYLGPGERWEDNWQLNSTVIEDPNLIFPGQKLELLVPPKLPDDGALLTRVSNRVEDRPTLLRTQKWYQAENGEILRPRDGVKTYDASSAQLRFGDDSLLMLTESSTVFLGEEERRQERVERRQIVIEVGQADLQGPAAAADMTRYEIVLGDARATPRAAEDSALKTRARTEDGAAQLMVYSGESGLSAAGAEVTVGTGMGSSVPAGEPPAPPEKLLPAPLGLDPAGGSKSGSQQPSFSWQEVADARDYTIEVCRDPECGALLQRVQKLAGTSWQPEEKLPYEPLYWRVTAISRSGLDGFPSDPTALEIVSDATPPEVRISFTGPRLAPRGGLNRSWIVGPGSAIEVEAEDEESGVEEWTAKIDGEEVAAGGLKAPWEKGEHELTVTAKDGAGNTAEKQVVFVYDPDPPALSWGVEGDSLALGVIESQSPEAAAARRDLRGRRQLRAGNVNWQLDSDLAQIRLRPQTRKPIRLEGLGTLGHRQGLWVLAEDEICPDLENLTYELVAGAGENEYLLWVQAVDCVGNAVLGRLPLARKES